jgi:hypothetical protein
MGYPDGDGALWGRTEGGPLRRGRGVARKKPINRLMSGFHDLLLFRILSTSRTVNSHSKGADAIRVDFSERRGSQKELAYGSQ